ncbi:MAG TPA: histidine ammonia-lyase [Candidatus Cloacimonetes bacterium]|nr:histidine ammonia-lyase [Candidatus Cloacimonadota bacterium]HEX38171.1 histidine ammonia-lyase [Candidatus Cloacimonadota bacterium]
MKMIYLDGTSLTLNEIYEIAHERTRVELTDEARKKIIRCRKHIEEIIEKDQVVYGVNTGFGAFKDKRISRDKLKELQRNLIISHSTGVGYYLSVPVVRAIMLLRINSLASGYSGIRMETLQTLIEMLNKGIHPAVPAQGSVGASGDLAPISHIILVLSRGEDQEREEYSGRVIIEENTDRDNYSIKTISGLKAMHDAGIERVILDAKEGLALNNGTNVMTAIAALALVDAQLLFENAVKIFTASLEGLRGVSDAYLPKIHELRRQKGQIDVANKVMEYIQGSKLTDSRRGEVQDSYSLRCFPQVAGPIKETLNFAANIIEREANAVTDNPLIIPEITDDKLAFSGGNFHGEPIAQVCDFLKIAIAELGNISERRIFKLTSQFLSHGLPSMLTTEPGLQSGIMILQYTAAALVSENKVLAHPASVDSIPTSEDVEDHVSMGTIAARQFREILENVKRIIAIEYITACQALDLRLRIDPDFQDCRPETVFGHMTYRVYSKLRDAGVEFWERDKVAYIDIEKTLRLITTEL